MLGNRAKLAGVLLVGMLVGAAGALFAVGWGVKRLVTVPVRRR